MFRLSLFCLIAMLLWVPRSAVAQGDAPTTPTLGGSRIGFVDVELVLAESRVVRAIAGEIDEELGRQDRVIREKRRELQRLRLSLEQQGNLLSEEERRRRQQTALDLVNELDELEYKLERETRRRQATTIEPLLEAVVRLIGEVGNRDGYDLIVRGETVLWGGKSVDLTPLIVRELDSREKDLRAAVEKASGLPPPADAEAPTPTLIPMVP